MDVLKLPAQIAALEIAHRQHAGGARRSRNQRGRPGETWRGSTGSLTLIEEVTTCSDGLQPKRSTDDMRPIGNCLSKLVCSGQKICWRGRLAKVRYALIAAKFRIAAK